MDFLKDFEKDVSKMKGIGNSSKPPRYWHSFGNHLMNYTMSGDFNNGIPQGRVTGLAGPSGSGKSFILGNIIVQAQKDGSYTFIIDSENALDDDFMMGIGVNIDQSMYKYKSVRTIPQVTALVSAFLNGYKKQYAGMEEDAPRVVIGIDSLDMLMTETEEENYSKGKSKGDQGQRNKQLKAMLRTFVHDVKELNVAIIVTSQVYKNQDLMNGEGLWIVSDAVRYSLSQICLLTKRKLRDSDDNAKFAGIRLIMQGFKTRFTKPFQSVEIEVPYDTGIDPYFGLLEQAVTLGVVNQRGAWFSLSNVEWDDGKLQRKSMTDEWMKQVLVELSLQQDLLFTTDAKADSNQLDESAKAKREKLATRSDE